MRLFKYLILLAFVPLFSAQSKTFVYCSEGSPIAFNPQVTTDGTSNNAASYTIYNRLVDFAPGSTEIIPSLAESFEISKDNLTYTFNLRKGVKFHTTKYFKPSREFIADDVLFSFNRQKDNKHPFHHVGGGFYEYFQSMEMGKLIKEIKKVDDFKIQIILTHPNAAFLANMAMPFMSILSKEYGENLLAKKEPNRIDHYPIGTGPFYFIRYVKDNQVRYKHNKDFFNAVPEIENLVISITPDANVRYQKLKTGECHFIYAPAPSDLPSMRKNEKIKIVHGPGLNIAYLAFNTTKKPFDNLLVRLAISHALNKQSYIKAIYMGHAMVAINPLPPGIWAYDKTIKDYNLNLKKSKELLKQAGYPNGFETEIWTLPINRPYNPNGKKMGEMMQADLAKIGIKAKLITYDWATYLSKANKGEHSLIQMGWTGDNGDPDNFLSILLGCAAIESGSNLSRWCDKKFNRLLVQAIRENDQAKRTKLYQEAQKIFKSNAPWVPIAHSVVYRAMLEEVEGYKLSPLGHDVFTTIKLQKRKK